jgi:hypothetical protein
MMRQADEAAWKRVRTQPRPARSAPVARGIGVRRLQLIVLPSFKQASVWDVRQVWAPERGQEWQLIRPRVIATLPELLVVGHDSVAIPSAALAAFFERVTSLSLPLCPDLSGRGGLDGTRYELTVEGDLSSRWRFQWWSDGPVQWSPLVQLAEEMCAVFALAAGPDAEPGIAPEIP